MSILFPHLFTNYSFTIMQQLKNWGKEFYLNIMQKKKHPDSIMGQVVRFDSNLSMDPLKRDQQRIDVVKGDSLPTSENASTVNNSPDDTDIDFSKYIDFTMTDSTKPNVPKSDHYTSNPNFNPSDLTLDLSGLNSNSLDIHISDQSYTKGQLLIYDPPFYTNYLEDFNSSTHLKQCIHLL